MLTLGGLEGDQMKSKTEWLVFRDTDGNFFYWHPDDKISPEWTPSSREEIENHKAAQPCVEPTGATIAEPKPE